MLLIVQILGVLSKTGEILFNILSVVLGAAIRFFVGSVALVWYTLELFIGFDRSVTEFCHAFTCGILVVLGLAVFCGKFDVARGIYEFFDPLLESLDALVIRVAWPHVAAGGGGGGGPRVGAPAVAGNNDGSFGDVYADRSTAPTTVSVPYVYPHISQLNPGGCGGAGFIGFPSGTAVSQFANNRANNEHVALRADVPPVRHQPSHLLRPADTDSCFVRYRSPSAGPGAAPRTRARSAHVFRRSSMSALTVVGSTVDPAAMTAMASTRDTTTWSTVGPMGADGASRVETDGYGLYADHVKDDLESLAELERRVRRLSFHGQRSDNYLPDDLQPTAPPLVVQQVSAESIWSKRRDASRSATDPECASAVEVPDTDERDSILLERCCSGKCSLMDADDGLRRARSRAVSTRDVSVSVSKSLTQLGGGSLAERLRAAAGVSSDEEGNNRGKSQACVVCRSTSKCMITMPCRHLCCCETCMGGILERDKKCPVCRESIVDYFKVFT